MNAAHAPADETLESPASEALPPAPPPPTPNKLIDCSPIDVGRALIVAREARRFEAMHAGAPCEACAKAFRLAHPDIEATPAEIACVGFPSDDHDAAEVWAFVILHWPEAHEPRRPGGNGARAALHAAFQATNHFAPDPEPEPEVVGVADVACDAPDVTAVAGNASDVALSTDAHGSAVEIDITEELEEALATGEPEKEEVMPKDAEPFDYAQWEAGRAASFKAEWVAAHPEHPPTPEQEAAWAAYAEDEIAYVVERAPDLEAAWRADEANAGKFVTGDERRRWGMTALGEFKLEHPREERVIEEAPPEAPSSHEEIADEDGASDAEVKEVHEEKAAAEVAPTEEPPAPAAEIAQDVDPAAATDAPAVAADPATPEPTTPAKPPTDGDCS